MNLILTINNADKPDAKVSLNAGAKMLINRIAGFKKQNPKNFNPTEHFTPGEIGFMVGYSAMMDAVKDTHVAKSVEKEESTEVTNFTCVDCGLTNEMVIESDVWCKEERNKYENVPICEECFDKRMK